MLLSALIDALEALIAVWEDQALHMSSLHYSLEAPPPPHENVRRYHTYDKVLHTKGLKVVYHR